MQSASSGAQVEQDDMSHFICGGKRFYVGEPVKTIGSEVVKKSVMVESFGENFETTEVTGIVIGQTENGLVNVRWSSLPSPFVQAVNSNCPLFLMKPKQGRGRPPKSAHRDSASLKRARPNLPDRQSTVTASSVDDIQLLDNPDGASPAPEFPASVISGLNTWITSKELDNQQVLLRGELWPYDSRLKFPTRFSCDSNPSDARPTLDYFDLMVPFDFIRTILSFSNEVDPPPNPCLTAGDLYLFLAVMYTMAFQPQNKLEDYWTKEDKLFFKALDFEGRLGMKWSMFKHVREHVRFGPAQPLGINNFDCIIYLQDSFNATMKEVIVPGAEYLHR